MNQQLLMRIGICMAVFLGCSQVSAASPDNPPIDTSIVIKGKITDKAGAPLSGVSVAIKGKRRGVASDEEGSFSIAVDNRNDRLQFSVVGYQGREIAAHEVNNDVIVLSSASTSLDEVMVVGYGTKSVREVTGSIGKVSGDKISNEPLSSFAQAMAGKTAGVQINMNGGVLADPT